MSYTPGGDLANREGRRSLLALDVVAELIEKQLILVSRENIPKIAEVIDKAIESFMDSKRRKEHA